MILVFLLYTLCALTFTLSKATLLFSEPFFYVAVRMMSAGVLLLLYTVCKNGRIPKIAKSDWWKFIQIALFHVFFAYVLDLWSLQYISSIESALVFDLSPFIAAILSYFWFKEVMTPKKWLGLILGFGALSPLIHKYATSGIATSGALPIIALVGAVFSGAYGWIVFRDLVKNRDYSPIFINGFGMLWGGSAVLLLSYFTESWNPTPVSQWPQFLLLTTAIVLVANIAFYNLYGYLLKVYTATFLAFAGFTTPIIASLFGVLFLGEHIDVSSIVSALCVIIGLSIFYHEELRQGYVAPH